MLVSELTVSQLYSLLVLAIIVCGMPLLAVPWYRTIDDWGPRLIFWLGFFFLYGLPAWFGANLLIQ